MRCCPSMIIISLPIRTDLAEPSLPDVAFRLFGLGGTRHIVASRFRPITISLLRWGTLPISTKGDFTLRIRGRLALRFAQFALWQNCALHPRGRLAGMRIPKSRSASAIVWCDTLLSEGSLRPICCLRYLRGGNLPISSALQSINLISGNISSGKSAHVGFACSRNER